MRTPAEKAQRTRYKTAKAALPLSPRFRPSKPDKPEPTADRPVLRGFDLEDAQPFATTGRGQGRRVAKTGDMLSETLLERRRAQRCQFCGAEPPSDPHHFPGKGSLGFACDLLAVSACRGAERSCHDDCQSYRIPKERQLEELGRALIDFCAQPADFKARVLDELRGDL